MLRNKGDYFSSNIRIGCQKMRLDMYLICKYRRCVIFGSVMNEMLVSILTYNVEGVFSVRNTQPSIFFSIWQN